MKLLPKIALFATFISLFSCSAPQTRTCSGMTWNTTYSITYSHSADLTDSIHSIMRQVELSVSPFIATSVISAVNKGNSDTVDEIFTDVFSLSQHICSISNGAFDPTLSPLINIWKFGYDDSNAPTDSAITAALSSVGIIDCKIFDGKLIKKTPETEFNFSAIAKGYGCDAIGRMMQRNGCQNFLIEIGGEITARGLNPKGEKWRVMIDAPISCNDSVVHQQLKIIEVTDCGVATSGNYRNFYTDSLGNRISHTISPKTGMPIQTETLSATVIAPDCATADALATACMAMPTDSAVKMISNIHGVSAIIVTAGNSAKWNVIEVK